MVISFVQELIKTMMIVQTKNPNYFSYAYSLEKKF